MRRAAAVLLALVAVAAQASAATRSETPRFRQYTSPDNLGGDAGEPTLGVNPRTGAVMFQAGLQTLRVTGFDARGVGTSTWKNVAPANTSRISFDPLLEMDAKTGRTWVTQLALACSFMSYTDNDGASWTDVPAGCAPGAMVDHQSQGYGPPPPGSPLRPSNGYPNLVYYCAQDIATAKCGVSLDGGYTYTVAHPSYSRAECSGLHGHLKSGPDGTIYLPPIRCYDTVFMTEVEDEAGVAVSSDAGLTWNVRRVPHSTVGDAGHPSLGVGSDGTVYFAYGSREKDQTGGPLEVAVTQDKGVTWRRPVVLGREFHIHNTRFPVAVAGDGDRAAVGFLGTSAKGDASDAAFKGLWHMYVSLTYDRGRTWHTYDATPRNGVQYGAICTAGTTCASRIRNLLDFNDMVTDTRGRVLIAFADGCLENPCTSADRYKKAAIIRQVGGRGLFRRFDR